MEPPDVVGLELPNLDERMLIKLESHITTAVVA